MNTLLEQAARVLEHQPTRTMDAEQVYRRAVRETGIEMSFTGFLAALRQDRERFAVVEPDPVAALAAEWEPRHRTLYRAALDAAGVTRPVVVLAERLEEPPEPGREPQAAATAADVLGDVQASLTHLLRTTDTEDTLYDALVAAVEEMHAVRRLAAP